MYNALWMAVWTILGYLRMHSCFSFCFQACFCWFLCFVWFCLRWKGFDQGQGAGGGIASFLGLSLLSLWMGYVEMHDSNRILKYFTRLMKLFLGFNVFKSMFLLVRNGLLYNWLIYESLDIWMEMFMIFTCIYDRNGLWKIPLLA